MVLVADDETLPPELETRAAAARAAGVVPRGPDAPAPATPLRDRPAPHAERPETVRRLPRRPRRGGGFPN
jgi:hypothetical protein